MIGNIWTCPCCQKSHKITADGVRCGDSGHTIYESLAYLKGYNYRNNTERAGTVVQAALSF